MSGFLLPRPAVATPGQITAFRPPKRLLPIVVVPGIMGTRLSESVYEDDDSRKQLLSQSLVWNPRGQFPIIPPVGPGPLVGLGVPLNVFAQLKISGISPGAIAFNANRLMRVGEPLYPDELNGPASPDSDELEIVNYNHLVTDNYGKLCRHLNKDLNNMLTASGSGVKIKVFCAGYDWRQSNRVSAVEVGRVVDKAYDASEGRGVIIVAHSQGGIVSRILCKNGYENKVRALILVGSPTLGAPKAYAMLRNGQGDVLIQYAILRTLSSAEVGRFCRAIPSIYQLCPTTAFGQTHRHWLNFDPMKTGYPYNAQFSDCAVSQKTLYSDFHTGFTEAGHDMLCQSNVNEAQAVHDALRTSGGASYMHHNTFCIYADGIPTVAEVDVTHIPQIDGVERVNVVDLKLCAGEGDGTVPVASASPVHVNNKFAGQYNWPMAEHGELCNDPRVVGTVAGIIGGLGG